MGRRVATARSRSQAGGPLLGISVEFPAVPETEPLWEILPDRLTSLARDLEESLPDDGDS